MATATYGGRGRRVPRISSCSTADVGPSDDARNSTVKAGQSASAARGPVRWLARAAVALAPLLLAAQCGEVAPLGRSGSVASDLVCRAKTGRADLSWTLVAGASKYRVWRGINGATQTAIGDTTGNVFVDPRVTEGQRLRFTVQALDAGEVELATSNACDAIAGPRAVDAPPMPPAVADLACRAKSEKVDLSWTAVAGAVQYQVLRGPAGGTRSLIGTTSTPTFADIGLIDGAPLDYAVRTLNAAGTPSPDSNLCAATPRPRDVGTSPPPDAPTGLVCRAKDGKANVTWNAVAGATTYVVLRANGGNPAAEVGRTTRTVLADFALANLVPYQYTVQAVGAGGAISVASTPCGVTPRNRDATSGNRAPVFTSTPTRFIREQFLWWYEPVAVDPDGDAVAYEMISGPPGAAPTGAQSVISWTPATTQVGDHTFEIVARDTRGATARQTFSVRVEDVNHAPLITSLPAASAKVGSEYLYTIDVFDSDGDAVTLDFDGAPPAGVVLDGAASTLRWTPTDAQLGAQSMRLRARDPAGAAGVQVLDVTVTRTPLDLIEPTGTLTMDLGTVLRVPVRANHAGARLSAQPLPQHAELHGGVFAFNPSPDQIGEILVSFEASLGEERDAEPVTIIVRKPNAAPVLDVPPTAAVDEGSPLRVPVSASDPDGDVVVITSPGLSLANAFYDQVSGAFVFHPDFTQAGSYTVSFAASDGTATTNATLDITVGDAAPVQPLDLVVDPPQTPSFVTTQTIRGSIIGQGGTGTPPPAALVTGLVPSGLKQGRSATVTLDVSNLALAAGSATADFGAGITVTQLDVISPTQARATVQAAADATPGPRGVTLSSNGVDAPSIVAFNVEPGAAQITGTVVDPFTQQPLVGARVKVNGSSVEATTDAQGRFVLDGVPSGARQIVVVAPNYGLQRLDVAVAPNADLALTDPIAIEALARPFSAGGTLPRAARLASVVDRNVGSRSGGLTQQQAEALVQDTMIVVGGREMGVRDDVGNQLNPKVDPESSSVTAHAVRAQAQRLVEGHVMSLGDILSAIILAFDWRGAQPTVGELLQDFQPILDAAWAHPNDPDSAMPIVLFNQGATLQPRPPLLTPETPINQFQAFLLCSSFLVKNRATLEESIDAALRAKGIDPDGIIADPSTIPDEVTRLDRVPRDFDAVQDVASIAFDRVFGGPAWAASQVVVTNPNQFVTGFTGRTFTKMWENTKKAAWAEATLGGLLSAGTAMVGAILTGAIAGAPAGVAGVTLGMVAGAAIFDTAITILFQKIIVGLVLAATVQQLEPMPPLPAQAYIEGDKLLVQFEPSVTESANSVTNAGGKVKGLGIKPEYLKYTYELLKFPDMKTTDFGQSKRIYGAVEPVPGNPKQLQFVVSKSQALSPGPNYFRIVTLQFVSAAQTDARVKWSFQYREDLADPNAPDSPGVSDFITDLKVQPEPVFDAVAKARAANSFKLDFESKVSVIKSASPRALDLEVAYKLNADANVNLASAALADSDLKIQQWRATYAPELGKAKALHAYANASGRNPAGFVDPSSPEYRVASNLIGPAGGVVPDELALRLESISSHRQKIDAEAPKVLALEKNRDRIKLTQAQMKNANPGSQFSGVFDSFDANGRPVQISFTVQPDAAGRAELAVLLDNENIKLQESSARVQASEAGIKIDKEGIISERVGKGTREFELTFRDENVRLRTELEKARLEQVAAGEDLANKRKSVGKVAIEILDPTAEVKLIEGKRPKYFKPNKAVMKAIDDGGAAFSATTNVTDTVQQFLENVQEMVSDLSPVLVFYDNPIPATSARPLVTNPNLEEVNSFLSTKPSSRPNPPPGQDAEVDGRLVSLIPGSDVLSNSASMGFPSDLLASDNARWVYALNKRSSMYGGRIFRFDASKDYAREQAGTVNYYSALIQFGRPATPVAMAMAHGVNVATRLQADDLLVADIDFTTTPPQHRIVQVPVSFADVDADPVSGAYVYRNPAFADGKNRDRIVGQPYATHPNWNFLDITEIVAGPPESSGTQRHYLSNGSSVYVLKQDLQTGVVDVQLIFDTPGRSWSGLAFDGARNLLVADKNSGDVITLSTAELLVLETAGGSFCGNVIHVGTPKGKAVRVAVTHDNRNLAASTEDAGARIVGPLPVLLEDAAKYQAVALKGPGHEYPTIQITQQNCPPVFLIEPSEIDLANGRLSLRVQTRDPNTLQPIFSEINVSLFPFGVTRVKAP